MAEDRFDPVKDALNRQKHKLPLAFGDRIFEDERHVVMPSIRAGDGEDRFKVVGIIGDRLFTAVFVWRGGVPRFMSVRRSNTREERTYRDTC